MIDFHCHVLPEMDDGSKSTNESIQMLELSVQQKITIMALTPHFYADTDTPERFFERRSRAFENLCSAIGQNAPQLLLGAEVHYFSGIHKSQSMMQFRLQGTKYLLLEMPFCRWTHRMLDEVSELNQSREITVVLAHIDRYLSMQKRDVVDQLFEDGVLLQANAESFLSWRERSKMLHFLENGYISFLGSDCHNLTDRPPRIGDALDVIEKKLGADAVQALKEKTL